jgi:FkbM family methyltransferase
MSTKRLDENIKLDGDLDLPFGHFAPNAWQRFLITISANSFLHRGLFRRPMMKRIMGAGKGCLDVNFRSCSYRLRGSNNLIEDGILLYPSYNHEDIEFLLEGVQAGDTFIDIGANIGLYTLPLAKKTGPSGKVVAIDANTLMTSRLAWNAKASGLDNIRIFPCAVSDNEGTGSLVMRKDDIAIVKLRDTVPGNIPIRKLTSILAEAGVNRIDALKIDIEGHEDRVLAPFIDSCDAAILPARIVIERPGAKDYPACAAAFAKRGYVRKGGSKNNSFFRLA